MNTDSAVAVGTVVDDLDCRRCGYNIRAQPLDGRCPECGLDVAASSLPPSFRFPSWTYVRRVRMGLVVLVASHLPFTIMTIAMTVLQLYWYEFEDPVRRSLSRATFRAWNDGYLAAQFLASFAVLFVAFPLRSPRSFCRRHRYITAALSCMAILADLAGGRFLPLESGVGHRPLLAGSIAGVWALAGPLSLLCMWLLLLRFINSARGPGLYRAIAISIVGVVIFGIGELLTEFANLALWLMSPRGVYSVTSDWENWCFDLMAFAFDWGKNWGNTGSVIMILGIAAILRRLHRETRLPKGDETGA